MTMRSAMRWAAGFAMVVGLTASAQVSLSSAVDLALRNDPRVKIAQADVSKAKATLSEAHDAYIPSATASGGYGTSTGVPLNVPVLFSISSQSLLFNFAQKDNIRAAEAGVKAAQFAADDAHDKVAEDVIVTYLDLNHDERRRDALQQEYDFVTRLVTIVQERLDAGTDTRIDLLKARKAAAQIHLEKLQTDDEISALSDHLSRMIGLPGNALTTVPASIPELPSLNELNAVQPTRNFGVEAAYADAHSKREIAFGLGRYKLRPEVSFGANYSRIYTNHTNYSTYYPAFASVNGLSYNDLSVGLEIRIPLFDRGHEARARQAAADAAHAEFEAQQQRMQFLEGRHKLQHTAAELADRTEIANDNQQLSQAQLDAVLARLSAASGATGGDQLSPEDEQNARVDERARYIDLLDAQYGLQQAQVNLLRQTGQLDAWLKAAMTAPGVSATPAH
ncbi:MAG: TolC family protein [Acidobacteriota bacterium]